MRRLEFLEISICLPAKWLWLDRAGGSVSQLNSCRAWNMVGQWGMLESGRPAFIVTL